MLKISYRNHAIQRMLERGISDEEVTLSTPFRGLRESPEGSTTVTLEKNESTIVFKKVPAQICNNCGESYVDGSITKSLLSTAENAFKNGIQIDVRVFHSDQSSLGVST